MLGKGLYGSGLGKFQKAATGGGDQPFVVQYPLLDERLSDTSDLLSVKALAKSGYLAISRTKRVCRAPSFICNDRRFAMGN